MADTGVTPLNPQQTEQQGTQRLQEGYLHRDAVALDEFVNVLTDGDLDETISSRAARAAEVGKKWGIDMSKFLDLFQKDHGPKAQAADLASAEQIEKVELASGGVE